MSPEQMRSSRRVDHRTRHLVDGRHPLRAARGGPFSVLLPPRSRRSARGSWTGSPAPLDVDFVPTCLARSMPSSSGASRRTRRGAFQTVAGSRGGAASRSVLRTRALLARRIRRDPGNGGCLSAAVTGAHGPCASIVRRRIGSRAGRPASTRRPPCGATAGRARAAVASALRLPTRMGCRSCGSASGTCRPGRHRRRIEPRSVRLAPARACRGGSLAARVPAQVGRSASPSSGVVNDACARRPWSRRSAVRDDLGGARRRHAATRSAPMLCSRRARQLRGAGPLRGRLRGLRGEPPVSTTGIGGHALSRRLLRASRGSARAPSRSSGAPRPWPVARGRQASRGGAPPCRGARALRVFGEPPSERCTAPAADCSPVTCWERLTSSSGGDAVVAGRRTTPAGGSASASRVRASSGSASARPSASIALSKLSRSNDGPCTRGRPLHPERASRSAIRRREAATASTIGFAAGAAVLAAGLDRLSVVAPCRQRSDPDADGLSGLRRCSPPGPLLADRPLARSGPRCRVARGRSRRSGAVLALLPVLLGRHAGPSLEGAVKRRGIREPHRVRGLLD